MAEPNVVPRSEHPISRTDIDPDALKVLYRLRQFNHTAYLVGGSVRDLLLGRRPKDFDIGTSAHPYEVKRLFRNCWIIGRRFRLAHIKFGTKTIEVATFRRQVPASPEPVEPLEGAREVEDTAAPHDRLIHRDNTFGTPEEDAFRRDFTINALFYDIASFSIIDYVGGLNDLRKRIVRSIGDPEERFREDPVRMLRAIAIASRLEFAIDPLTYDAIRRHHAEIARSAAPRLLEEYYKILRAGAAERAFAALTEAGLLWPITPELDRQASPGLWRSLAALDAYRRRFESAPDSLTNPILLGSLLAPLGFSPQRLATIPAPGRVVESRERGPVARAMLGVLPIARRDIERLGQALALQRRLRDLAGSPRARRALMHRSAFTDALTWLEIHGDAPEVLADWRALAAHAHAPVEPGNQLDRPRRRYRRRRRRRRGVQRPLQ